MNLDCKDLSRFLNGQMSAAEQGRFREHLGGCEDCGKGFGEALQLDLLAQETFGAETAPSEAVPSSSSPSDGGWARPRQGVHSWMQLLVAGFALLLFAPSANQLSAADLTWLVRDGPRALEARVTHASLDSSHQPFVAERSGSSLSLTPVALPLQDLWRMEARGDLHGVATAYLLSGALQQAQAFLDRMPPSSDRDCDLALVSLERARREGAVDLRNAYLEKSLELLSQVLSVSPGHPQALWNRGLVLRELGLTLQAAASFGEVAKLGEPGWSAEAADRERALRESGLARGRKWAEAYKMTRELMADMLAPLPVTEARALPGVTRAVFYDVLRTAPTRQDVLRLLPLARALDEVYGGRELQAGVARVADRDFARRGPLARRYAQLVLGELPSSAQVMEELRHSGEDDLSLGVLIRASRAGLPRDSGALIRLAKDSGDEWLRLIAEVEGSQIEQHEGLWWKAEQRLLKALEACRQRGLTYRCLDLDLSLTELYLGMNRPADAFSHAWSGWSRAEEASEWGYEQAFLMKLADVARVQGAYNTARAYLEESLLRMPEDCAQLTYIHQNLAMVEWNRFRPERARASLERALECKRPLGITAAVVLSELARSSPQPNDEAVLRASLAEQRRGGVSPGTEALLLIIEGQFELARSRDVGHALIWRGLLLAEQLPESIEARKARAFGYDVLVSEAGRAGAWNDALTLMGQEFRLEAVPARCLVAVSVHQERTVVMVRGVHGDLVGAYSAGRTEPLRDDASGLVPAEFLSALGGCEHVDVLAAPRVQGMPRLLPETLAWSYHVGPVARRMPMRGGVARHLVVTEVASPPALRLPRLARLAPPRVPDPWRVELRGAEATPSRVLKEMEDASEVEIHAHGMFSSAISDASMVVLASDVDGRYALTADQLRQTRLRHAPLVLLAACGAARTAPFPHESFSLPTAFIAAGASAVLAASVEIPDSAGAFFEKVRESIRGGTRPSVALMEMRAHWLREHPDDARWLPYVLLFE